MSTATLVFENGVEIVVPLRADTDRYSPGWDQVTLDAVVGLDARWGDIIGESKASGAFRWGVTRCCGASDKGVEDGIVCRRCFNPIDGLGPPSDDIIQLKEVRR